MTTSISFACIFGHQGRSDVLDSTETVRGTLSTRDDSVGDCVLGTAVAILRKNASAGCQAHKNLGSFLAEVSRIECGWQRLIAVECVLSV